mmetsp:Transcript_13886/g.19007  ORF Transcript_13886/g.19007 Transcript_13886/m.19007 type:complete len:206 (-) Transcript_13886:396-1013(-)|eukprot:CAMPEP_0185724528 /NCGR_PEP_ID=MMETSP1171-20130828/985_1 /TAXON_ID=374046 /ORGANISM="Helicotheca tamensis, Strain CCMP826" /LENGTH=205 /DNA_ID=CAMNT_0028392399 /DNA_START=84 /DNA_END=701 /DNA_ORIENTATION=+
MAETCRFNVGGSKYEVSRSLLEQHPNTMLARISSEQWQKDPEKEIFIDRDGDRFRYCLDYLRDGHVALPVTVAKKALLQDLEYYGVEGVDEGSIDDGLSQEVKISKSLKVLEDTMVQLEKEAEVDCLSCAIMCYQRAKQVTNSAFFISSKDKDCGLARMLHYRLISWGSIDKHLKRLNLRLTQTVLLSKYDKPGVNIYLQPVPKE